MEFLNQQMDPAEVLAVEIRQYAGKGLKTFVPRVLGQTTEALTRKTTGTRETRQWDEPTFFAELTRRTSEEEARVAKRILDWSKDQGCWIWWGKGLQDGPKARSSCSISVLEDIMAKSVEIHLYSRCLPRVLWGAAALFLLPSFCLYCPYLASLA